MSVWLLILAPSQSRQGWDGRPRFGTSANGILAGMSGLLSSLKQTSKPNIRVVYGDGGGRAVRWGGEIELHQLSGGTAAL